MKALAKERVFKSQNIERKLERLRSVNSGYINYNNAYTSTVNHQLSNMIGANRQEVLKKGKIYGNSVKWKVIKLLALVPTGEVYKVLDVDTGKLFVVKKLQSVQQALCEAQEQNMKSLLSDLAVLTEVCHPNIVSFKGFELT